MRYLSLAAAALAAATALAGPAAADGITIVSPPAFTVDPVGKAPLTCALGLPGVGVPCGSNGPMTSGTKTIGTVYRECTVQKRGTKYDTSSCDATFAFNDGSQIGVRALVPVPHAGVEAKAFDGYVLGGTLAYEGWYGTVHYEPTATAGQYAVTFH
ncbi:MULTISPECIES: hypothetical protein [Streptomyces]|uniref:hypothetical protein n=1 Tax=Streptomyces TaxID=1883 RepID=UPI000F6F196A|nr:hypothetical protein [Streptomyces sp. W1SF4]AZM89658.1 hypothetical protein D1J60_15295 [Streptomyces sp. W1SF4]